MTEIKEIIQKPHALFEWRFSRNFHIYEIYLCYYHGYSCFPFPRMEILIGVTENIETDRIIPFEYGNPKLAKLYEDKEVLTFGYVESVEKHLRARLTPVPQEIIGPTVNYLKKHALKD